MGYYFLIVHINSGNSQGSDTVHLLSGKRIIEHWLAVNIHLSHTACSPVDIAKYPSKFFYIQGNIYIYTHAHSALRKYSNPFIFFTFCYVAA